MFRLMLLVMFCFSLFLITHAVLFHKGIVRRRFATLITLAFIFTFIYCILFYFIGLLQPHFELPTGWDVFVGFLNGVFVFAFYYYFYFHFIVLVDRSVSTKIMVEIEKAANKKLSPGEIKQIYSLKDKVDYELEDMIMLKMIERKNIYFSNTKRGKRHAFLIGFLRQYLNLIHDQERT